ncbi:MAG: CpaF family protein [Chloroflexota bacterium]
MARPISQRLLGVRIEADPGSQRPTTRNATGNRASAAPNDSSRLPGGLDLAQITSRVQRQLMSELGAEADLNSPQTPRLIENLLNQILDGQGVPLSRQDRSKLLESVLAELLSFGPIEPLLRDDTISEIMVNGPHQVYIERSGTLYETEVRFEDDDHVRRIIDRIIAPLGRRCDEASPMVDARLPDGSRVNAIIPPLSLQGPVITIRKFSRDPLTMQNLIQFGSVSPEAADFLAACVAGKLNVLVSGGTGSGKTTLLNVLSSFIPGSERIVTIEDAAELQLRQRHVISLEKRPANIEGKGEIGIRQLVINALRMRPDRVVVGEVRGPEALDMLQAMNTGHDGSMTTLHSNSPRDTLGRLETMVLMTGFDLPHRVIREQIASAVELIVHQERMLDGSRKITRITEVQGMEQEVITLQDVYTFNQTGLDGGRVVGKLAPTGTRPKFLEKLEVNGIRLPPSLFQSTPERTANPMSAVRQRH